MSKQAAIQSLRGNSNIDIKESDNGGAVVLMDIDHYKQMSMDFYKHLDYNEGCKANYSLENMEKTSLKMRKII